MGISLSRGMSIVSPKSSFSRVHVRALTASGSLKFRLQATNNGRQRLQHPPGPLPVPSSGRAPPLLPHPAGEGGLYVLPELGVLAGQVREVGRLVLVPVASVHRLVEGHGGRLLGGAPLPLPPSPLPRRHSAMRSPRRLPTCPAGRRAVPRRARGGGGSAGRGGPARAAVREERAAAILRGWVK